MSDLLEKLKMKTKLVDYDPTAEKIAEELYHSIKHIKKIHKGVYIDYVAVYENENSKATYSEV
jgi:hypothetical protein